MSQPAFDPYHEWLGIEPWEQPVDYYRLLSLARFEAEPARIAQAADERMAHIRQFQLGPRGALTQSLLNELAAARICLLDVRSKTEYDAALTNHLLIRQAELRAPPPSLAETPQAVFVPAKAPGPIPRKKLPGNKQRRKSMVVMGLAGFIVLLVLLGAWWILPSFPGLIALSAQREKRASAVNYVPKTTPGAESSVVTANPSGELIFPFRSARLQGSVRLERYDQEDRLTQWSPAEDRAEWQFRISKPGFYKAELTYAVTANVENAQVELVLDGKAKSYSLRSSGDLGSFVTDEQTIGVASSGLHRLAIGPRARTTRPWFILESVRFFPIGSDLTTGSR